MTYGWTAIFFFLAYALRTKPSNSLLISQMQGWQTAGEFRICTIVHNVWHSLWRCATGTGWIWSLIPVDEVGCTSTLASAKVVQRWPQASMYVESRRCNGRVHDHWALYYIWSSPLYSPFLSRWHFFLLWFLGPYWTSWCKADFRMGLDVWYQGQSDGWRPDLTEKLICCCHLPDEKGSDVAHFVVRLRWPQDVQTNTSTNLLTYLNTQKQINEPCWSNAL